MKEGKEKRIPSGEAARSRAFVARILGVYEEGVLEEGSYCKGELSDFSTSKKEKMLELDVEAAEDVGGSVGGARAGRGRGGGGRLRAIEVVEVLYCWNICNVRQKILHHLRPPPPPPRDR